MAYKPKRAFRMPGVICVLLLGAASLFGQSNEAIDRILSQEPLTYGAAAYLVLTASGDLSDSASFDDAVSMLHHQSRSIDNRESREPVTLGEYSYLVMQALSIRGGIAYRLFPGPRYAARELAATGIAQDSAFPSMHLSGERAVRLLGRALAYVEGERL